MNLPSGLTIQQFHHEFRGNTDQWEGAVREVAQAHHLPIEHFKPFADGSNLIASISSLHIVKIFPPFHRHQWESESRALKHLAQFSWSIPIPQLIAAGERADGWTYVVFTRLSGTSLNEVWNALPLPQKSKLMREIGRLMHEVHALKVGDLSDLKPEWNSFLLDQKNGYRSRHERLKMPDWLLKESENFIETVFPALMNEKPVILTGEYTPFNLLVETEAGETRLTGMIDFGDVQIGQREYDFLGPILFLAQGNADLISDLFSGYGIAPMNPALQDRLALLMILHRYSNLRAQIQIKDWESLVQNLHDLKNLVFPI
jgi:hygromycin-B 7''-O-kinase